MADLDHRELIVFRDPRRLTVNGHAYQTRFTRAATHSVSPLAAPGASAVVAELLPLG